VLLGEEDADDGDVRWGANLNIGYYDQRLDDFDEDRTVIDQVSEGRPQKAQEIRDALALMLFRGEDIDKQMGMLSGGERARVRLAQLLLDKPNVLVLDEPTNHLDIASCEALENALRDFVGTILCVSHDRYFLDKTVGRMMVLKPPGMQDFSGNYSAWVAKQKESQAERASAREGCDPRQTRQTRETREARKEPGTSRRSDTGVSRKSGNKDNPYLRPFGRLTMQELEREITDTEVALAEAQQAFGESGSFKEPGRGQKLQAAYDAIQKKLKQLEAEYFQREQ
jgi:ATP-binding cassette subfamily F protein 3